MGVSASKILNIGNKPDYGSPAIARLRIYSPRGASRDNLKQLVRRRRMENEGLASPAETAPLMKMDGNVLPEPPIQVWITPALCCAMAYALYNIFIKKGSAHINPVLGGVILQIVAAILGICLLLFVAATEGGAETINYDNKGITYSVLAGLSVGMAEMISFFVSSLGVPANKSIPVIIGGSVLFGTLLGWLALNEELSFRAWTGVVMSAVGIALVGMDT